MAQEFHVTKFLNSDEALCHFVDDIDVEVLSWWCVWYRNECQAQKPTGIDSVHSRYQVTAKIMAYPVDLSEAFVVKDAEHLIYHT